ncbi:FitA-like ribbon-helix-helix domain-containing protein [Phytoactinopolyspora limicola]|uniref:FitA-like ribbon-helix-helix domain-containing protein n=1 Tax=Phytoactinopolyspora limicola TaxID=2715536 RepID=UPI001408C320|nr:hypothetical protein [Phytoactinopolyspora limicola]
MAAIHIRDVSDSTLAALRERAARHGHSMQHEIRRILDAAAREPVEGERPEPGRSEHARAQAALNDWPAAGTTLSTSGQFCGSVSRWRPARPRRTDSALDNRTR